MKIKCLFILALFCCLAITTSVSADEKSDWQPITIKVNDVAGQYNWSINWDISFHYKKFDKINADGNGVFINRQIDKNSYLPSKPLITGNSKGIDEFPNGANVSMASMPESKRIPGSGGEIYNENDGKTAHQRDWDALVITRDMIFRENGVTDETPIMDKVKLIADWAHYVNKGGPVYESKHPVDLIFHRSFCVGRANGFVGMMHTIGLPARTVNMNGHSVGEVLIDGKWYYVENISTRKSDTRETATLMPCSLMEFYGNPFKYKEYTSESHLESPYFKSEDLHNGRGNWQLGGWWYWHFIQCAKGDDMMMRNTMKNGSGIAVTLNGANSAALYPNAENYYYKVIKGNPPVMTNYQKETWYRAGHRVLQGDWIRKKFYIGNLDDKENPVEKITSRLYLMGGETQSFAIPPVIFPDDAEWTLKINGKEYKLKDCTNDWQLVKEFEPDAMMPVIYFEFQLNKEDLKQNDYNIFEFGSAPCENYRQQHIHVMIYPEPMLPYFKPYKQFDNTRKQTEWRIITDQKWDWLQISEYAW